MNNLRISVFSVVMKKLNLMVFATGLLPILASAQSMPWGGFGEDFQVESDPYQGVWEGQWSGGRKIAAQVVARGEGKYAIRIQDSFHQRYAPFVVAEGKAIDGALRFEAGPWHGSFKDGVFEGMGLFKEKAGAVSMKAVQRLSPTLGLEAPAGAVYLFDGTSLDEWISNQSDGAMTWKLVEGKAMEIGMDDRGQGHKIKSRRTFNDARLHLEFRLPLMPTSGGQKRSNSGFFIHGYEIQILDSFGLEGYNNECGAFYKFKAPSVNKCAPPLQWQTYDVEFRATRFDVNGEVAEWPRFTVKHNGQVIHRDLEMTQVSHNKQGEMTRPASDAQPISLQFHGARVQFRNIWVVEM